MLSTIPADPNREKRDVERLMEYLRVSTGGPSGLTREQAMMKFIKEEMNPASPPPKVLPCANVQVEAYTACEKPGTRACAACKLVSYCSKECQQRHWKKHKIDCKHSMRSDGWVPAWRREGRHPSFITDGTEDESKRLDPGEFNGGTTLWGNMPAIDLINLKDNENDETKDLSLGFFASGDLRHVIKTINSLPSTYSGKLDILINDVAPFVSCRNLVLMLILGGIHDEGASVDIALHFWYSAFWPMDYRYKIATLVMDFMDHVSDAGITPFQIGDHSSIEVGCFIKEMYGALLMHYTSPEGISNEEAQAEYDRVRSAYSRRDYRDRMYASLKSSHRVAFYEYRRFGIVLPFGAANAHFNCPNASLFSGNGRWLQTDYSDPLEGWDLDEVVERGKAYGATSEDIYGCLYFFLSEQLREFYRRIRQFPINFKMFGEEATKLADRIQSNSLLHFGLSSTSRFDRIEVSNIIDFNYVGLEAMLTCLSPLLAQTDHAVIVGYFMNWFLKQKDGRTSGAGKSALTRAIDLMLSKDKSAFEATVVTLGSMQTAMFSLMQDIDLAYDNSKPFSDYLDKQGVKPILQKTGLTLRSRHRIVPHRLMVPLKASSSALPEFPSKESCYYHTKLNHMSWAERFVEFGRKQ